METNKIFFGFWLGVAVISIINVKLNLLNKNQLAYDCSILAVSIIALIVFTIISNKTSKKIKRR